MDRLTGIAAVALAAAAAPPPIPGALVTTVQVRRAGELAATLRECRGRAQRDWTKQTVVVDRRFGRRRSLTYRTLDGRSLASCDSIGVPIEGRRWCGAANGTLYGGRLRDPRLVLCEPRSGRPVGLMECLLQRRKLSSIDGTQASTPLNLNVSDATNWRDLV